MARVRFTIQARDELKAVLAYYEHVGAGDYAEIFEERLFERVSQLEDYPRLGRVVPEIEDESIREIIYRAHRVVYVVDQDEDVDILTIFHSSQQFGST